MAKHQLPTIVARIPLVKHSPFGLTRYLISIRLLVSRADGTWEEQAFLVDTGTTLTFVPIPFAERAGLPFDTQTPIQTATVLGRKKVGGYLFPFRFALVDLPGWEFTTLACFSHDTPPGGFPLLSGSDLFQRFTVFVDASPQPGYPFGSILLQPRDDHGGQPRAEA